MNDSDVYHDAILAVIKSLQSVGVRNVFFFYHNHGHQHHCLHLRSPTSTILTCVAPSMTAVAVTQELWVSWIVALAEVCIDAVLSWLISAMLLRMRRV